jgi:hypothetical protein
MEKKKHKPRVVFWGWPVRQLARAKATQGMGGRAQSPKTVGLGY